MLGDLFCLVADGGGRRRIANRRFYWKHSDFNEKRLADAHNESNNIYGKLADDNSDMHGFAAA